MELLFFCFLIFVSRVHSQALLSVLQNHFELSTFNQFVNNSESLTNLLSSADNVTLFAPSNTAFEAWIPNQSPNLAKDQIEALLMYHLVHGVFPSIEFLNQPQFPKTFLTNTSYANVTGGQRVEIVSSSTGNPEIVSGNKAVSYISTTDVLFTGGLIQIIDTVLTLPLSYVILITQANFRFLVAILNAGGYLSPNDTPLVNSAIYTSSNTFFAPNTQAAVDTFNSMAPTMSQDQLAASFNYHFVPGFLGYSSQLKDGMQLRTSQGTNLTITVQGNTTYVNGARIITYDYLVCNGVVHMIDSILNPSNTTGPPPLPSPTGNPIPNTTTPTTSTSHSSNPPPKAGWSSASKAGLGVGIFLILVSLTGATYFILRWLRKRKSKQPRSPKPKVVWNIGPVWARKVGKEMKRSAPRAVRSPQELDAEEQKVDVMSPGVSEASMASKGRSRQGSWGGELDGSGRHYIVRGHRDEV